VKGTPTGTETTTVHPMLTRKQLMEWLGVSAWTIKGYMRDPQFMDRCVLNVAVPGSHRKAYRFHPDAVTQYLNEADSTRPLAEAVA
jgi:hypothetical protein